MSYDPTSASAEKSQFGLVARSLAEIIEEMFRDFGRKFAGQEAVKRVLCALPGREHVLKMNLPVFLKHAPHQMMVEWISSKLDRSRFLDQSTKRILKIVLPRVLDGFVSGLLDADWDAQVDQFVDRAVEQTANDKKTEQASADERLPPLSWYDLVSDHSIDVAVALANSVDPRNEDLVRAITTVPPRVWEIACADINVRDSGSLSKEDTKNLLAVISGLGKGSIGLGTRALLFLRTVMDYIRGTVPTPRLFKWIFFTMALVFVAYLVGFSMAVESFFEHAWFNRDYMAAALGVLGSSLLVAAMLWPLRQLEGIINSLLNLLRKQPMRAWLSKSLHNAAGLFLFYGGLMTIFLLLVSAASRIMQINNTDLQTQVSIFTAVDFIRLLMAACVPVILGAINMARGHDLTGTLRLRALKTVKTSFRTVEIMATVIAFFILFVFVLILWNPLKSVVDSWLTAKTNPEPVATAPAAAVTTGFKFDFEALCADPDFIDSEMRLAAECDNQSPAVKKDTASKQERLCQDPSVSSERRQRLKCDE